MYSAFAYPKMRCGCSDCAFVFNYVSAEHRAPFFTSGDIHHTRVITSQVSSYKLLLQIYVLSNQLINSLKGFLYA
jgi:hypothetical protein